MLPPCLMHFSSFFLHILQSFIGANDIYRYGCFCQTTRSTTAIRWRNDWLMIARMWCFWTMFWWWRFMLGTTTFRWWLRRHGRHRRLICFAGHVFIMIAGRTGWWCWARRFGWWSDWRRFHFILTIWATPRRIIFICIRFGYLRTMTFLMVQRLAVCAFD